MIDIYIYTYIYIHLNLSFTSHSNTSLLGLESQIVPPHSQIAILVNFATSSYELRDRILRVDLTQHDI